MQSPNWLSYTPPTPVMYIRTEYASKHETVVLKCVTKRRVIMFPHITLPPSSGWNLARLRATSRLWLECSLWNGTVKVCVFQPPAQQNSCTIRTVWPPLLHFRFFHILAKRDRAFVMPVCLPVCLSDRVRQFGSHWTDFRGTVCWRL